MKSCPFCHESILDVAIKCRYCRHFLDGREPLPDAGAAVTVTVVPTPAAPTSDATLAVGMASVLFEAYEGADESPPAVVLRRLPTDFEIVRPARAAGQRDRSRYDVVKVLGEGAMGRVYLAEDRDLKRRVALKTILDERHRRRFIEEAQILAQLDHPNILPLHDLGTTGKKPYCTMRLVRGMTLDDVIEGLREKDPTIVGRYRLTRLMQVFIQICQAMDYAHAKGVVHRDLKPGNVMLGEHGEVQVLDWGLATVLAEAEVTSPERLEKLTAAGVVGTPAYMAPEQAMGKPVDARSDVYGLGVMLYELLTLKRPFKGDSLYALLGSVVSDEPPGLRDVAPNRSIPGRLEEVCLKALEKEPEDRWQTAGAFGEAVQSWLEEESDRERRHQLAEDRAAEAEAKLQEYRALEVELVRLREEAKAAAGRFKSWQPIEEKAELVAAEDAVQRAARRLNHLAGDVVEAATKTVENEPENARGRKVLADYYFERFMAAERTQERDDAERLERLVARYDDDRYGRVLKGDGSLELQTDPPGAEVRLYDLVEEGFIVVERNERRLGVTPLAATPLAMGSYLVVLKKEGYRDTRYPVYISRNREWVGEVKLHTDAEIGEGFLYVPAGPLILGGDDGSTASLPRTEPELAGFAIAQHPVTHAEYLLFVNHLAQTEGLEAAKKRSQRAYGEGAAIYLIEDGSGGLTLPEVDADGDRWDLRHPVLGISWHDAVAFCAWRSSGDGVTYRLPSEAEWEKSARGVDGRWFPWGWRFDASLCNMRESRKERPSPVAIDEFPRDVSVYGVRGLGGNMRDWTATEFLQGEGEGRRVSRVYRGGSWSFVARFCRAAARLWIEPTLCVDYLGFRLSKSLPHPPAPSP